MTRKIFDVGQISEKSGGRGGDEECSELTSFLNKYIVMGNIRIVFSIVFPSSRETNGHLNE